MTTNLVHRLLALLACVVVFTATVANADEDKKGDKKSSAAEAGKDAGHEDKKDGDDHAKKGEAKEGEQNEDGHKEGGEGGHKEAGKDDGHGHDEGGGGHGHHDPMDRSHANSSPDGENPAEFKYDLAIYTAVVFVLLLLILRVYAWGPIMEGLQAREERIASMISEAEKNAEQAKVQAAKYEEQLAAATEEARALVTAARKDADAAKERILAEAEEARQKERERFQADIEAAKSAALDEVAQRGAQIAVELAGEIIQRELKPSDHEQLISESLDKFSNNN